MQHELLEEALQKVLQVHQQHAALVESWDSAKALDWMPLGVPQRLEQRLVERGVLEGAAKLALEGLKPVLGSEIWV